MSTEDVNNAQVVTETQDANIEQVVTAPDVNTEVVDQQVSEQAEPNQAVPYDRFKEVNDQKKAAEEQAAYAQRQLELMQMQAQNAQIAQVQRPSSTYEQAMQDLSITADDLYGENMVRVQNRKSQLDAEQSQKQTSAVASQQFAIAHPDINQVAGSVNPVTGQFMASSELLSLLRKKPNLTGACTSLEVAYELVMQERQLSEYQKTQAVNKEQQVRQNVENITQPLGGSAAGGSGGGVQSQNSGMLSREQSLDIEARLAAGETFN